jgi:catechol 2,3-dioxygenase-like lactoylglutathione lyase family enzyme
MVGPIESVTVAVRDLGQAERLFEKRFGFTSVSQGRASVGLLSAWRYPVHESVRLAELGHRGHPHGRIRLALFEDAAVPPFDSARGYVAPQAGPQALDFRSAAAEVQGGCLEADDELPLLIVGRFPARASRAQAARPLGSVWVLCADAAKARAFYTEALGYQVLLETETETEIVIDDAAASFARLGLGAGARLHVTRLGAGAEPRAGVLLVQLPDRIPAREAARLGTLGINLLTCRCDDLDELIARMKPLGSEPVAAPSHVGLPDGRPGRVMVTRAPGGEVFEFIEIDA